MRTAHNRCAGLIVGFACVLLTACDPGFTYRPVNWTTASDRSWTYTVSDVTITTRGMIALRASAEVGRSLTLLITAIWKSSL